MARFELAGRQSLSRLCETLIPFYKKGGIVLLMMIVYKIDIYQNHRNFRIATSFQRSLEFIEISTLIAGPTIYFKTIQFLLCPHLSCCVKCSFVFTSNLVIVVCQPPVPIDSVIPLTIRVPEVLGPFPARPRKLQLPTSIELPTCLMNWPDRELGFEARDIFEPDVRRSIELAPPKRSLTIDIS